MYVSTNQKDWDKWIEQIVFAINTSQQETTKFSSFYLLYGREARLPLEAAIGETKYLNLEEIFENMHKARNIAKENIEMHQAKYAEYVNKDRRDHNFKVGDKDLLRKFNKRRDFLPSSCIIITAHTS